MTIFQTILPNVEPVAPVSIPVAVNELVNVIDLAETSPVVVIELLPNEISPDESVICPLDSVIVPN